MKNIVRLTSKAIYSFPVFTVLGLMFIFMKLAELGQVKDWSWIWVLSPFWIPSALAIGIIALYFIFILWIQLIFKN